MHLYIRNIINIPCETNHCILCKYKILEKNSVIAKVYYENDNFFTKDTELCSNCGTLMIKTVKNTTLVLEPSQGNSLTMQLKKRD